MKIRLKYNGAFLVADSAGDFRQTEIETGLYWQATRYLRACNLFLAGQPAVPLAFTLSERGDTCQFELTNMPLALQDTVLESNALLVRRSLELRNKTLMQHIEVTSYRLTPLTVKLRLDLKADFEDIFEVKGWRRKARGTMSPPLPGEDTLTFRYRGLDDVERETILEFTPPAQQVDEEGISWNLRLNKGQTISIRVKISMVEKGERIKASTHASELEVAHLSPAALIERPLPEIHTSSEAFDRLITRGMNDLLMLCTMTPEGLYPYAGIPWFACPFGRDALIASLQFLPWFPEVAHGTLSFLAAYQGKKQDPFTLEEPGRILHEFRYGELANCREISFIPYYGSIDVNALFIITLASYVRWTNDSSFLIHVWPHAKAAAQWMRDYGDQDGDMFLEHQIPSEHGLMNQGWKDSGDSISHTDGALAPGPSALCEVQGGAYAAYRAMSYLADRLSETEDAAYWSRMAEQLQAHFLERYWWDEESTFYLALDGEKRPCAVVSSNPGQCLWTGIVPDELAQRLVDRLMREDVFSGWGIRTLSTREARYNPMGYHNGTVWPHDTAIIGAGFARYGRKDDAGRLLEGLLHASRYFDRARLPELFCGFERSSTKGPVRYPVACEPQAWAAGAPCMLLSALLGFAPDAGHYRIALHSPKLPDWLEKAELRGLRLGGHEFGLRFEHLEGNTLMNVIEGSGVDVNIRQEGPLEDNMLTRKIRP